MITTAFILTLAIVETNGVVPHNPGPHGERGHLQITPILVRDVNRIYGTHYTLDDCYDKAKAEQMCRLYLSHYATPERIGREVTNLDRARIWNGGPKGWRNQSTQPYAEKFIRVWMQIHEPQPANR